jgi:putative DNA primase/helicase
MFAATGNNLVVSGDMVRRTIVGTLDPKMERPEIREFANDPVEVIRRVAAALVVLRAYVVVGMPKQAVKPLGSFEGWSRMVRDALIWLGEDDPCETMERTRAADPQTQALGEALHQWHAVIGDHEVSVKRVIEYAAEKESRSTDPLNTDPPPFKHPDFREALLVVAGDRGLISSQRMGRWLGRVKGRVVGNLRLDPGLNKEHGGAQRWKVSSAEAAPVPPSGSTP